MRKLIATAIVALAAVGWVAAAQDHQLPGAPGSVKFAVLGDNGTGAPAQYEVGRQMAAARERFPFEFVIMLGDNMYGRQRPQDYVDKFERPYAPLLQAGVPFFAALGNHDHPDQRFYKGFNMGGERYYTFARPNVRFVIVDTNLLDTQQIAWIDGQLSEAREEWKIVYFHHPLYSDAMHGSNVELRVLLEPLLVKYSVPVTFAGHEHVYERTTPQKGVVHFVAGSGGQLRKGDITPSAMTAASFDEDQTFMLVEIVGDDLFFQAIARSGRVVDSGVIHRRPTT
jgi:hypothetical protein